MKNSWSFFVGKIEKGATTQNSALAEPHSVLFFILVIYLFLYRVLGISSIWCMVVPYLVRSTPYVQYFAIVKHHILDVSVPK